MNFRVAFFPPERSIPASRIARVLRQDVEIPDDRGIRLTPPPEGIDRFSPLRDTKGEVKVPVELQPTTYTLIAVLTYLTGILCAVFALWRSRTPQGAAAWAVALVTIPFFTVPFFLILGRNKFYGYVKSRKHLDEEAQRELDEVRQIAAAVVEPEPGFQALQELSRLTKQPGYTDGNSLELLIDGEATFDAIYRAIEGARHSVLFQFYIYRDDKLGNRFAELLRRKAREGVRVYFLYDGVGTKLKPSFLKKFEAAGVHYAEFRGMKYWTSRVQVNFRNHRKIVVVDGRIAFTGGFNVGDDYLGEYPDIGPWRDTHVRIEGPAALSAQLCFVKDWFWAEEKLPDLDWAPQRSEKNCRALLLATGPADDNEPCLLAHLDLIRNAQKRLWIANPYFVPPESLIHALELAVLRGVDVRILVPSYTDNKWISWASETSQERALAAKLDLRSYQPGFLHEKVVLVDDRAVAIGSVNLDSRSFFINFEATLIAHDPDLVRATERMLEHDFARAKVLKYEDFAARGLLRQIRSRAVNLLSPML